MEKRKAWRDDLVRFHVEFGPESLFMRIRFKMKDVHELHMDGVHFNSRVNERNVPKEIIDKLKSFSIDEWSLKTAEVRRDRGKFYNSTWERILDGTHYWVTIGLGNVIETIVCKDSSGVGKCVRCGEYYDFVERVNRELMEKEDLESVAFLQHSVYPDLTATPKG